MNFDMAYVSSDNIFVKRLCTFVWRVISYSTRMVVVVLYIRVRYTYGTIQVLYRTGSILHPFLFASSRNIYSLRSRYTYQQYCHCTFVISRKKNNFERSVVRPRIVQVPVTVSKRLQYV